MSGASDVVIRISTSGRLRWKPDSRAISHRIAQDTGLPKSFSDLLGVTLAGMSQVSARAWLAHSATIPQADAALAAGHLAWRGLSSYPSQATLRGGAGTEAGEGGAAGGGDGGA